MTLRWLPLALLFVVPGCAPVGSIPVPGHTVTGDDDDATSGDDDDASDDDDDGDPGVTEIEEVGGSDADPNALLYDWGAVHTFEILLEPSAINALEVDPYTYVQGSFVYEGHTYAPVGVRLKGQGSFQAIHDKPAFKVKFNEYVPGGRFSGVESLTLNNMVWDYSMMHERLAYAVYREAGVPSCRSNHAEVWVNGQLYGLYANTESTDQPMIARWFEDTGGSMFEGWDVDFYDHYISSFQLDWGVEDRTNLQGLADALEIPGAAGLEAAEDHVDFEEFLRYWAVGAVVGQFDGYPYTSPGDDFQVYDDPTTGRLHFLPWGTDETFYYPDNSVSAIVGIVAARCSESPECLAAWRGQIGEVLDLTDQMDWVSLFDEVSAQIEPYSQADPRKPYSNSDVNTYQWVMRSMMEDRRAELEHQLGPL